MSSCFNSNPSKLEELFNTAANQGRKPFLKLILNILNTEKTHSYYCFCKNKRQQCLICATASTFRGTQYGLYQHSLDIDKSNLIVVSDLQMTLKEILRENNHFVCTLINNKFLLFLQQLVFRKKISFHHRPIFN